MRSNLVCKADFQQPQERNFYWTPPFVVLVWPQKECGLRRRGPALLSLEPRARESTGSVLGGPRENWLQKQQKKKDRETVESLRNAPREKNNRRRDRKKWRKEKRKKEDMHVRASTGSWEQRPCCVCSHRVPTKHLAEGGRRGRQGEKRRSELVPGWKLCFQVWVHWWEINREWQLKTIKECLTSENVLRKVLMWPEKQLICRSIHVLVHIVIPTKGLVGKLRVSVFPTGHPTPTHPTQASAETWLCSNMVLSSSAQSGSELPLLLLQQWSVGFLCSLPASTAVLLLVQSEGHTAWEPGVCTEFRESGWMKTAALVDVGLLCF